MDRIFIGIGSNIEPETNVERALEIISDQFTIVGISTFYQTEPIERPEQENYYNGVIEISADFSPVRLHEILTDIEIDLGRIRTPDKFAPRTIDLDILIYGNIVIENGRILIPDPDVLTRSFISHPIAELAPEFQHPITGKKFSEIANGMSLVGMKKLDEFTARIQRRFLKWI